MTRQLILAYGRETEHRRAVLAVLSFWTWYEGDRHAVQTVVFTDRPEFFAPYFDGLPVEYRLLTSEELRRMRGPLDYVHRIKLSIISQIGQEHPNDALFFFDSDTFFVAPAAPLLLQPQPGISVMHQFEYPLTDAVAMWASFTPPQDANPRKMLAFLESQPFVLAGTAYQFSPTYPMWNTGVIGLAPETTTLLPDILALGDQLYAASQWIISEQAAFSLALHARTSIVASNQYVFHYWSRGQKQTMDGLLADLEHRLPSSLSLPDRLTRARKLTSAWLRIVKTEEARQTSRQAFQNGQFFSGAKQAAKAFLIRWLGFYR